MGQIWQRHQPLLLQLRLDTVLRMNSPHFHWLAVDGNNPNYGRFEPYSSADAAAMVADGSITNNPVFNRAATELLNPNATFSERRMALAVHVPAVSTAMGGTAMAANNLESLDLNLPSEGREYKNGWGRDASLFGNDWQHSDMKDMAYFRLPREFSCRGRGILRKLLHCLILSADRVVMKTSVLSQATP